MSHQQNQNRRDFLKTTGVAATATAMPYWFTSESAMANAYQSPNERPVVGCIGTGSRWGAVGPNALQFGDGVAVCDVDSNHAGRAQKRVKDIQSRKGQAAEVGVFEDYQKVLDNKEIDVVTIVTTDHWHTKIAVEAMQAGKHVYCEKPLTLTIEEGKQIRKVQEETGKVFQVGTQQRSEMGLRFLTAVAIVHAGRIGKVEKVQCAIGGAPTSGSIPKAEVPKGLNWDKWLGQAPMVDFRVSKNGRNKRHHYEFRWWYEYSGGKMTDWGAHHVDIAQWAIQQDDTGPVKVEPLMAEHPVPYKDGHPTDDSQYNAATKFLVKCTFPNGVEMGIRHDTSNGVRIKGTEGEIFVSRGNLIGDAVTALKENPLPDGLMEKLYKGKKPGGGNAHMKNFFDCVKDGGEPVSDVKTHHRAMTTCHLANIAIRLDRTLNFDPKTEQIVGDKEAQAWQGREQRKGYEINVDV